MGTFRHTFGSIFIMYVLGIWIAIIMSKEMGINFTYFEFHGDSVQTCRVMVDVSRNLSTVHHFWESTGLCPPLPPFSFLLGKDMILNLALIGALPRQGIMQVRIHWLLNLLYIKAYKNGIPIYSFENLDKIIHTLWTNNLRPGFELMGNPSNYYDDFENKTQVYLWRDLIKSIAKRYIEKFGLRYVQQWNFESWNEPDHKDFNGLNFTIQGFLNYYDACSEGLLMAHPTLRLGGPAESLRRTFTEYSEALLHHCAVGKNYFTGETGVRIDFIALHEKGNATSLSILEEELEVIDKIHSALPALKDVPIFNDEADPMVGWWKPEKWRADATYAGLMTKAIIQHLYALSSGNLTNYQLLSNDNGFLNFFPSFFDQRTLLTRFQMNNSAEKEIQMIRKPIYAATGLLKYFGNIQVDTLVEDKLPEFGCESNKDFGALATYHKPNSSDAYDSWNAGIFLYNVGDLNANSSTKEILFTLSIKNLQSVLPNPGFGENGCVNGLLNIKYIIYKIDNVVTNPNQAWFMMGKPIYPSAQQLLKMRSAEEPYRTMMPVPLVDFNFSLQNFIRQPGIFLMHICEKPRLPPRQVLNVNLHKVSRTDILITWFTPNITKCILTYEVQYSKTLEEKRFKRINVDDIIFQSFHHSIANKKGDKLSIQGFYRVRAVDYWNQRSPWSKIRKFK